ncbi:MAG: (Fe-S)-binding protein [Phycisphaerae bacterium]|nr:(Fe-S)-binding protein [Phycisphaerae bacterium]
MNPLVQALLLVGFWGWFLVQADRRWRLMRVGAAEVRWDRIGERLRRTYEYAFAQKRMRRYWWAGIAHQFIFVGFVVLLLRTLILWGRGFRETFDLPLLAIDQPLGMAYSVLKDVFVVLVILGTLVFFYYRLIARPWRMSRGFEGILILLIISTMMAADLVYDGAEIVRRTRAEGASVQFHAVEPAGSIVAFAFTGLSDSAVGVLRHAGFWTHGTLVLLFLNLLPISKHFHVITAIPNVFFSDLTPRGRLRPIADMEGKIERGETLGIQRVEQFSWKAILDLYTCTECGRCSDVCPATSTGKRLSPKHLTLDLRDHLYRRQREFLATDGPRQQIDLVGNVLEPEVVWACTTCRACETECPVFITYVDKIVDLRRHLVMEKSEFPPELQNAFRGMESNGNPWSFPASDRAAWAAGLDIPTIDQNPGAEILFWVGCSASFDDRARKIARATAQLLKAAGVNFAILGPAETCTGDPARRAGNEFLFQMLAQANVETLNAAGVRRIVTSCPHCFNTLRNEYPDFGGNYEVIHHSELLSQLVREGRLTPKKRIDQRVAFHDSCYLGRYNDVYDPPREVLRAIPGLVVLEPAQALDRGMCCGAGGAQMFKEEEHGNRRRPVDQRVNLARTEQLLDTRPDRVASACPFCQRMLIDGLAAKGRESVAQQDIAELLLESVSTAD